MSPLYCLLFWRRILIASVFAEGTTIVCAGTQNASGFTGFAKETIAEWMAREMPGWKRVLQIPLPSFAGKDEALFVFEKTEDGGHTDGVVA